MLLDPLTKQCSKSRKGKNSLPKRFSTPFWQNGGMEERAQEKNNYLLLKLVEAMKQ